MRADSQTLIGQLLAVVNAWRKRDGLSRETVVQAIVEAHERVHGPALTGIRFEPHTADVYERMKVNADRVFRWLDDATKDNNLLPANFIPSILEALPRDLLLVLLTGLLAPLQIGLRDTKPASASMPLDLLRGLMSETAEATQAVAALIDGATDEELQAAQVELTQAQAETSRCLDAVETMLGERGR